MPGKSRFAASLALALTLLAHLCALKTGYVYDDVEAILENQDLQSFRSAGKLLFTNYWGEARNIGLYRPMVQWSYLVDGAFGFDPIVSHTLQIGLHGLVVLLLHRFLLRLPVSPFAAFFGATALGIHPALTDASVWISGRCDVLCLLFMLAGLTLAQSAARAGEGTLGRRSVLAGVAYVFALLSKEMALPLPILIALLPGRGHLRRSIPLGAAFAVYVGLRALAVDGFLPGGANEEGVRFQDAHPLERPLLGLRAILRLLSFLIVPVGLAGDHQAHPFAQIEARADAGCVAFLALGVALGVLSLFLRKRSAVLGFLAVSSLASLVPVLQFVPIGAAMAERFLYVPAAFLLPLTFQGLWLLLKRPLPCVILGSVVLTLLSVLLQQRIAIYRDRVTYQRDVLRVYPQDEKAWNNLGVALFLRLPGHEEGPLDFEEADRAFAEAIRLRPRYRRAILNRARARLEAEAVLPGRRERFLDPLETWLKPFADRGDPSALYLLGKASLRTGDAWTDLRESEPGALEWAKDHYELAHARYVASASAPIQNPRDRVERAVAWKEAGIAALRQGHENSVQDAFRRALELDPGMRGAPEMRARLRN